MAVVEYFYEGSDNVRYRSSLAPTTLSATDGITMLKAPPALLSIIQHKWVTASVEDDLIGADSVIES